MKIARLLFGVIALLTTLAITTTPASATFTSLNGTSSGALQLETGNTAKFTIEVEGTTQIAVACGEVNNGAWKIRKSDAAQEPVVKGGHLNLSGQFTKCVATLAGQERATTVNSGCELQVRQTGTTTFDGSVAETCIITTINGCVVTIAKEAPNEGLKKVEAVNVSSNVKITSVVTNFVAKTNETCKKLGVTGSKGGFNAIAIAHTLKVE
jgi:hypothetical protein